MKRFLPYLLAVLTVFSSCDQTHIDFPGDDIQLVVEGWIENGHAPVVIVSTSLPITSDPQPLTDLAEHIARYAEVSVETDGQEYYLSSVLSDDFTVGNYYSSSELRGVVGKTYNLTVRYDGFCARATCSIPEPPVIISLEALPEESGSTFSAELKFAGSQDGKQFYMPFLRMGGSGLFTPVPSYAICGESPDEFVCLEFGQYNRFDELEVKIACMQEPVYDFWTSYQSLIPLTDNVFFSNYRNIKGNMDGGIGYWAGYGVSSSELLFRTGKTK